MKAELYSIWTIQETRLQRYRGIFLTLQAILMAAFAAFGDSVGAAAMAGTGIVSAYFWLNITKTRAGDVDLSQFLILLFERGELSPFENRLFELFRYCQNARCLPVEITLNAGLSRIIAEHPDYKNLAERGHIRQFMGALPFVATAVWLVLAAVTWWPGSDLEILR